MRLNGWQRLWLVASLVSLSWVGLLYPWSLFGQDSPGNFPFAQDLKRDYESGKCLAYVNADFASLSEPPYAENGGNCWYLYTSRKYDRQRHGDKIPYTFRVYEENHAAWKRKQFRSAAIAGSVLSLVLSAIVYAIGLVTAWIVRGFRGR